jgi:hypothetical protein
MDGPLVFELTLPVFHQFGMQNRRSQKDRFQEGLIPAQPIQVKGIKPGLEGAARRPHDQLGMKNIGNVHKQLS